MRLVICNMLFLAVLAVVSCEKREHGVEYPEHVLTPDYDNLELAWSDEFTYEGLPAESSWGYEEGYVRNEELQDYKKADLKYSYVENGVLVIKAVRDSHESPVSDGSSVVRRFEFSSASLTTKDRQTFGSGRIDILAKIPTGRGLCPAFTLLPADGGDESVRLGMMRYVYGDPDARDMVYSTVSAEYLYDGYNMNGGYVRCATLETAFHLYSVVMSGERLTFLFDGRTVYTLDKDGYGHEPWPFSGEFYLIINVAVGGIYGGTWGIDTAVFPKQMEIDYVRYYRQSQ